MAIREAGDLQEGGKKRYGRNVPKKGQYVEQGKWPCQRLRKGGGTLEIRAGEPEQGARNGRPKNRELL